MTKQRTPVVKVSKMQDVIQDMGFKRTGYPSCTSYLPCQNHSTRSARGNVERGGGETPPSTPSSIPPKTVVNALNFTLTKRAVEPTKEHKTTRVRMYSRVFFLVCTITGEKFIYIKPTPRAPLNQAVEDTTKKLSLSPH